MAQSYDAADFVELAPTEGVIRIRAQGQSMELPYKARNYVNKAGTIGYAAVDANEKVDFMFISNSAGGVILTFPGETAGPVQLPIEGYGRIMTASPDAGLEQAFATHQDGLGGAGALADRAWLDKELPGVPRRVGEVMSRLFTEAVRLMDNLPDTAETLVKALSGEPVGNGADRDAAGKGPGAGNPLPKRGAKKGAKTGGKAKPVKGARSRAKKDGKRR